MKKINVGKEFHFELANRDELQGDRKFTAIEFRQKYLSSLDNKDAWNTDDCQVVLDFADVEELGPSFANEAFAYFTQYASPEKIQKVIRFENMTPTKDSTLRQELDSGYRPGK